MNYLKLMNISLVNHIKLSLDQCLKINVMSISLKNHIKLLLDQCLNIDVEVEYLAVDNIGVDP